MAADCLLASLWLVCQEKYVSHKFGRVTHRAPIGAAVTLGIMLLVRQNEFRDVHDPNGMRVLYSITYTINLLRLSGGGVEI